MKSAGKDIPKAYFEEKLLLTRFKLYLRPLWDHDMYPGDWDTTQETGRRTLGTGERTLEAGGHTR